MIKPTRMNESRQNSLKAIKSASLLVAGWTGKYFSNVGLRVMFCTLLCEKSLAICNALTPDDGAVRINQDDQPIVPSEVWAEVLSTEQGSVRRPLCLCCNALNRRFVL